MTEYNLYDSNNVCDEINWDKLSLRKFSERISYQRYVANKEKIIVVKSKNFSINIILMNLLNYQMIYTLIIMI